MSGILRSALILSMAGFITKLMGALYRIPFARMVGDEGLGLYQMAYPFYTIILAISTAGIPVAISKLVAESHQRREQENVLRIFWVALGLLFSTGLVASLALYYTADEIAQNILGEPRATLAIKYIAPAIFFTSIMSAFRGFFQGQQNMLPTALSQVLEQMVRILTVFWAAVILLPSGVELAAAGATFGAATGGLAGLLLLIVIFYRREGDIPRAKIGREKESWLLILFKILALSIPISLGGLVLPLMQLLDTYLVPLGLQKGGLSSLEATRLYGQLSGMAGSLINLPTIITLALSASLVPASSRLFKAGQEMKLSLLVQASVNITILFVLPAALGLIVLARPISDLLFNLPEAGVPLAWLAGGIVFVGLYHVSTGVLQGLGRTTVPVISLLIGAILKLALTFIMTPWPTWGIRGAALATVAGFAVAAFINLSYLARQVCYTLPWTRLFIPCLAGGMMIEAVLQIISLGQKYFPENITTLLAIPGGALVYGLLILLLGGLRKKELLVLLDDDHKWHNFISRLPFLR